MPAIFRRTFLERLGLGAGAALLGPSMGAFLRDAHAQSGIPKRLFFIVQGNGMNFRDFAPPGHKPEQIQAKGIKDNQLYVADGITLPPMFASLAPFQSSVLQVDGLSNQTGQIDHTFAYGVVTCMKQIPNPASTQRSNVANILIGDPGGPSIDQYVASVIGKGSLFPSVLLGPFQTNDSASLKNLVFASAASKPVPVMLQAQGAYKQVFANVVPGATAGGVTPFARRKKLLDFMRADVKRAKAALGPAEQPKMDQLLTSLETLDAQMAQLSMSAGKIGRVDLAPIASEPTFIEDRADLHFQIATTALTANLTRVISYNAQATNPGIYWRKLGFKLTSHAHGHGDREDERNPLDTVHNFHAGLLLRTIKALQAVPEGGKTMWDNTIVVWLADSTEAHHGNGYRVPTLVMAAPGGFLKTGGRYVRFPVANRVPGDTYRNPTPELVAAAKTSPACRSQADLYCTIAHAVGAPTDAFGKGGPEVVHGVLPELVA